jgi:exodeoxyribonuclease-5
MFAKVRADDCAFVGLGAEAGLVDGVKAAADWAATLAQWRAAIAAIAGEVCDGHAAVSFASEDDLKYCDVLPLLRLPEVKSQREESPAPPDLPSRGGDGSSPLRGSGSSTALALGRPCGEGAS